MKSSLTCLLILCTMFIAPSCNVSTDLEEPQKADLSDFIGQWTIDVENGGVSWLEVWQDEFRLGQYLDADLLWNAGSVTPVSDVYLVNNEYLVVTRTAELVLQRDEDGNPLRSHVVTRWLEIHADGDDISGNYCQPRYSGMGIDTIAFTGKKLPLVPEPPDLSNLSFADPIVLFNGTDLAGWRLTDTSLVNGFVVVDGSMVNNPVQKENEARIRYGNIRTEQEFEDFNLTLEVNIPEGSNSGIYLRGMYEIQVLDSYGLPLDSHNMGALYSRITPTVNAEKPAGTWQSMDITLCDRHLTVILNDVPIIENKPIYGPTGGAIQSDVFAPGPIYLQGDHGTVSFRNMILTPIVN